MNHSPSIELLLAAHRVVRLVEDGLRELGTSPGEAVLLIRLSEQSLTMSGITEALHIGGSTATSLVTRLERTGLAARQRNPEDARSFIVDVTPAGRAAAAVANAVYEALDQKLTAAGPSIVTAHAAFMQGLESLSPARQTVR